MPVWETPPVLLERALGSVLSQDFDSFELIAVDDGSKEPGVAETLRAMAETDSRMRVVHSPLNQGIVAASNLALGSATGEFIALMDHDDILPPHALRTCAEAIGEQPECDLLYTDEAWIDEDDRIVAPFLKPDWSPERLRSQMYVNHLAWYRRQLVESVGGFREGFDGSQDYDLALRVSERSRGIIHVPQILYHWRIRPGQVSGSANPAVYAAARRAIEEHCSRVGIKGSVEQTDPLGVYRVRRELVDEPLVSIVVPTCGSAGLVWGEPRTFVAEALRSVETRSSYPHLEYVVVADTTTPPETLDELRAICGERLRVIQYKRRFNFSRKCNLGVLAARGEYVMFLNDDVEVITPDWIESMLGLAQQQDVGLVGCALYFEDGTLQHGGHLYVNGVAGHIGYGAPAEYTGPEAALTMDRECSGVTAACALMRRSEYLEVGGLSWSLPVNFNDVDLCLKVRRSGRRIVWTPHARLYHFESKSRDGRVGAPEVEQTRRRWGHVLDGQDPYWRYPDKSWVIADASVETLEAELQTALRMH